MSYYQGIVISSEATQSLAAMQRGITICKVPQEGFERRLKDALKDRSCNCKRSSDRNRLRDAEDVDIPYNGRMHVLHFSRISQPQVDPESGKYL
ncbi:hypothetical protein MSWH1_2991 [Methanosarcina sp. WH1]|nr:hypothetical protein MSWH1_2991 [Methanosarcina sp. WH1]